MAYLIECNAFPHCQPQETHSPALTSTGDVHPALHNLSISGSLSYYIEIDAAWVFYCVLFLPDQVMNFDILMCLK